ncbi:MAG: mevalonate kinase [Candidatus Bathyarchaeia archaeon]
MSVTASSPAKIILFGEHFVVYGEPALVTAIDKRAYASAELRSDERIYVSSADLGISGYFLNEIFQAEYGGPKARVKLEPIRIAVQRILNLAKKEEGVNVKVHSSIPVAAGLGSSAAVAAAAAGSVGQLLGVKVSQDDIFQAALEAERFVHGTPSGIDPAIATYGGVLLYYKGKGHTCLKVEGDLPLVVGNTGMERSTGEMVAQVRKIRERHPSIFNPLIKAGGKIVLCAMEALKRGDLNTLGELMNINHAMLSAVGVSNEALDRLVHAARKAGALGAKLTGAGGGGCMIALSHPEKLGRIVEEIEREGGKAFVARKTNLGVNIERS